MNTCNNLLTPQCKAALLTTPAATRVLLFINISIYIIGFLVPRDRSRSVPLLDCRTDYLQFFKRERSTGPLLPFCCIRCRRSKPGPCRAARLLFTQITLGQFYRIISTAFFHLSLMHIAFNSMTLHNAGSAIEARSGTLSFALCTLALVPACGIMNVAVSVLFNTLGYDQYMKECAAGFSGVLFAYVTMQALHRDSSAYSIYGFFTVPAKWYPLCMLVITQILLPGSSFVGHLGGILAGALFSAIVSRMPSFLACFQHLEWLCSCPALSASCFFIPYPVPAPPLPARYIPGIIIGDTFHPVQGADQLAVDAAAENAQQPQSWLGALRSWYSGRCSHSPLFWDQLSPRRLFRYQRIEQEMQPPRVP
jgi:membrane associated rhomboid family serine protease